MVDADVSNKLGQIVDCRRFPFQALWKVGMENGATLPWLPTFNCHQHLCPNLSSFLFCFFCYPLSLRSTFLTLHSPFVVVVSNVVSHPLSLSGSRVVHSLSNHSPHSVLCSFCLISSPSRTVSIVHSRLSFVSSSATSLLVFAVRCLSMW